MADGPRLGPDRRRDLAAAYLDGAGRYDRVRPGYPEAVADWIVGRIGGRTDGDIDNHIDGLPADRRGSTRVTQALDVGAGTGLFTALLTRRGLEVTAVDPSEDMLAVLASRLPEVRTSTTTAEATGLASASVDLVTIAQAWHWCDPAATAREAERILRPGGRLALVWNQLDVSLPWVHRLSRIMHAGDVFAPSYRPALGPLFEEPDELLVHWTQELTVDDVVELTRSRSYYQRASESLRRRVEANLLWYLTDYLAFGRSATVRLPYYTHAWRASVAGR